jgi:hypothetical protein
MLHHKINTSTWPCCKRAARCGRLRISLLLLVQLLITTTILVQFWVILRPWFGSLVVRHAVVPSRGDASHRLDTEDRPHRQDTADGCGLDDGIDPPWMPYSENDTAYMTQLLHCVGRINQGKLRGLDGNEPGYRQQFPLTYLGCRKQVSQDIITQYDTIYMIGDSVLRQQFNVLRCMLDPHLDPKTSIRRIATMQREVYKTVFTHPNGKTTKFIYTTWGYCFEEPCKTWPLLRDFPAALGNGTHKDIIIVNAGHHYRSPDAGVLKDHANLMVELVQKAAADRTMSSSSSSRSSIPQVFFMETADENFPTSNGLFPVGGEECLFNKCTCRAVTSDMIQGRGILDPSVNWTLALGRAKPDRHVLDALFPTTTTTTSIVADPHAQCVPDCYPAHWRSDLTLPILKKSSNIHIVPVWRQLALRGIPNNCSPGDCTHKGVDTVIEMNRQLFRTIDQVRQERLV